VFDQRIGQDGPGKGILFIQFVGLTQQLNRFPGLLLREQGLALGDKAVGFALALHPILDELFQFAQLRIFPHFVSCAAQQIQGASVLARTQTEIDLLNEPRFGFVAGLLLACYLQAL